MNIDNSVIGQIITHLNDLKGLSDNSHDIDYQNRVDELFKITLTKTKEAFAIVFTAEIHRIRQASGYICFFNLWFKISPDTATNQNSLNDIMTDIYQRSLSIYKIRKLYCNGMPLIKDQLRVAWINNYHLALDQDKGRKRAVREDKTDTSKSSSPVDSQWVIIDK